MWHTQDSEVDTALTGWVWQTGVMHMDVKSGNVLVDQNGTAMLTDFGLAIQGTGTIEVPLTRDAASLSHSHSMLPLSHTHYLCLDGASLSHTLALLEGAHRGAQLELPPPPYFELTLCALTSQPEARPPPCWHEA